MYACGHGYHEVNVTGFNRRDKDSRRDWYERNVVCPECYKKQKQEEDARAPKELHGRYQSHLVFVIRAKGDIERNKEALANIGFKWHKNLESWELEFSLPFRTKEELKDGYEALLKRVEPLGYKPYKDKPLAGLPHYDLMHIKSDLEQYDEYKKVKDQIPPPPADTCYDFMRELHGDDFRSWNKKVYGKRGGYNYYIKGTNYPMSDEQRDAIEAYNKEREEWVARINSIPEVKKASEFSIFLPKNFEQWAEAVSKITEALDTI